MEQKELRLKLVEVILTNVKGLAPVAVIDVSKQYEAYINDMRPAPEVQEEILETKVEEENLEPKTQESVVDEPNISDKVQTPDDNQKEGRTGSDEPSKKKPR
jgi:hypothetical protein